MSNLYSHLSYKQRVRIKRLLDLGYSKREIAKDIDVHYATIYREIDRGTINNQYDPLYAEQKYQEKLKNKSQSTVLDEDPKLAEYISDLILKEKLSPEKIVSILKEDGRFDKYPASKETIYSYINKGKIPNVTRESLRKESSRIFCDGQIIIPKWVLKKLELKDGDVLDFELTDDGKIIYQKSKDRG